jgi:hypothetical protein
MLIVTEYKVVSEVPFACSSFKEDSGVSHESGFKGFGQLHIPHKLGY